MLICSNPSKPGAPSLKHMNKTHLTISWTHPAEGCAVLEWNLYINNGDASAPTLLATQAIPSLSEHTFAFAADGSDAGK